MIGAIINAIKKVFGYGKPSLSVTVATNSTPPKSKGDGPGTDVADFRYAEFQYFVANRGIYGYDYTQVIYRIDGLDGSHQPVDLNPNPNPPLPRSRFFLEGASFSFNYDGSLFRFMGRNSLRSEPVYLLLADACQAATDEARFLYSEDTPAPGSSSSLGYMHPPSSHESFPGSTSSRAIPSYYPEFVEKPANNSRKPTAEIERAPPLISTMTGLGNHLVEPATPSPALHDSSVYVQGQGEHQGSTTSLFHGLEATALRPRWLLSGQTPNKQEVDDLVRAMKDGRRQHDGDGPPLNCPLPCCENNKELRRPQALRDHLYFHFGIKPYPCDHDGCNMAFSTNTNRNRHCGTCRY